jgi:FAD/FMN-containing dehydrogenase
MSKVAQYLQEHLVGEVMTSADAREYFSTDGSILKVVPQIIAYPRSEQDVRKAARFAWQLAERGRIVPITARGGGTDQGGGAIGSGVMMVFPAHMNKILSLNTGKRSVTIQPGINYGKLQQALHTHGLFLPPFPASQEYSTVGGAIANNASGEKTIKYGSTREFVSSLRVVLANGEVIETGRLTKKQLNKKMGLPTFEGEIYRTLDALLKENSELISSSYFDITKNTAGYDLGIIKGKKGTFDLTPLFVGSQGTLGIITEAVLDVENFNPSTTLIAAQFNSIASAGKAIVELRKLVPSSLEVVDDKLLEFIDEHNPSQLGKSLQKPFSKIVLLIEFDDTAPRQQKKKSKKARKILSKLASDIVQTSDEHEQEDLWKIRHSAATVLWQTIGTKKAIPIIEDGVVPVERFTEFIEHVYKLFDSFGLKIAVWGHAGNANLHMQPFMDLSQIGDRQKIFKVMDAYYKLVIELGGSTSGEHNDGRLRAPYLEELYGPQVYQLFKDVKQIFDPYDTMNPGVKFGTSKQDLQSILRQEFSMKHLFDHMPRT